MKSVRLAMAAAMAAALPVGATAAPVYLNIDNISVEVGPNTGEGSSNNTFTRGFGIEKVIDAPSADAEEFHNQTTHIWYTFSDPEDGLELLFDFGTEYDISTLHFWNYTGESFDVDEISFTFFNQNSVQVGALTVNPALGTSPGITAQDLVLDAPLNVQFVVALLTGTNGQVDFQNIGFTADVSVPVDPIPVPGAAAMMVTGLAAAAAFRRRRTERG
ncbi:PEP-CTERM sorting domain-containing protein [Parvularcula oceani]|uniref:PEP-CTERM sorting domain-containing protein n=1 Tax=Parvularcula oceani TaxID=1247963 RepID=UPI0012DBF601|nr:PEP-CTERM sorting domain-containing protein [Parvularcula oceani]